MDNMRIDSDILTSSYFDKKSVKNSLRNIYPYVQMRIAETAKYLLFQTEGMEYPTLHNL